MLKPYSSSLKKKNKHFGSSAGGCQRFLLAHLQFGKTPK